MSNNEIIAAIKSEIVTQKRCADNVPADFKVKYEHTATILNGLLTKFGKQK